MDKLTLELFKKLEQRIREVNLRQGGPRGPKGKDGQKGRKGDRGAIGPVGPAGTAGAKGEKGDRGATGPQGKQGAQGKQGPQGPVGASGRDGADGLHGRDGTDGVGVTDARIDFDGHLTLAMSDGTEIDAGQIVQDAGTGDITYIAGGGVPDSLKEQVQDIEDTLNEHIGDYNNPHRVQHNQLFNITPNDHHDELHNLNSHTDVISVAPKVGQGLWWTDENGGNWYNRAAYEESWPTGLAQGGELNIGPGPNDIEVIAGLGVLVDSYTDPDSPPVVLGLEWDQINTPITAAPSTAGSVVWFSIYDTGVRSGGLSVGQPINIGALRQYAQSPSPTLSRQEIFLGVAIHNGVSWKEVSNPKVINQAAETLREVATTVLPLTTIIQGGEVSTLPAFQLDQAAGTVWENNRNWHVDKSDPNREALPAQSPITFEYVNRDFSTVGAPTNTIDPTQWDDGGVVSPVPGPANEATIQRVYLDPANNYWVLWGQYTYPNLTTAQANLYAEVPVVPFILQNSILLGYVIAEKGKTDWDENEAIFIQASGLSYGGGGTPITDHNNLNGIGPDDHHNQVHLLYGPDQSDVNTGTALANAHVLEWNTVNGQFFPGYRTKYIPNYTLGGTYYPQEWVANFDWLSICNTETTDNAFPTPVGDVDVLYPQTPPWLEASHTGQVRSGTNVTFTESGEVTALQVWIPEVSAETHYSVVFVVNNNNVTRISLPNGDLTAGQWNTVAVGKSTYIAGDNVNAYLESQNYGSVNTVTGGWQYQGVSNINLPTTGGWNRDNNNTIVRISTTDLDSTDRTTELNGIVAGSTLRFVDTITPGNFLEYITLADPVADVGTEVYSVSLVASGGTITTSDNTTLTATIPVPQATKFVYEPDKWLNDSPTWATITSYLEYDDVPQAVDPNIGYGINFNFQQLEQSPDWNLIPIGSGAGGGGGDFTPSTFTGAGTTGYVPDPTVETGAFLADDGTWQSPVTSHDELTGVSPDQHHAQAHAHDGTDGSGLVDYGDLINRPGDFAGPGTTGFVPDPVTSQSYVLADSGQWVPQSGGATEVAILQLGHGFAPLDCIRYDGTSWVKAQADDVNTTALGVVVEVADVDNFVYAITGRYQLANTLLTDEWYFLSPTVAGGLDANTPPISQPIIYSEANDWVTIYAYRPDTTTNVPAQEWWGDYNGIDISNLNGDGGIVIGDSPDLNARGNGLVLAGETDFGAATRKYKSRLALQSTDQTSDIHTQVIEFLDMDIARTGYLGLVNGRMTYQLADANNGHDFIVGQNTYPALSIKGINDQGALGVLHVRSEVDYDTIVMGRGDGVQARTSLSMLGQNGDYQFPLIQGFGGNDAINLIMIGAGGLSGASGVATHPANEIRFNTGANPELPGAGLRAMNIYGDQGVTIGNNVLTSFGQGTLNVATGYYVAGVPQANISQVQLNTIMSRLQTLETQVVALGGTI